jgi:hypothetical protein
MGSIKYPITSQQSYSFQMAVEYVCTCNASQSQLPDFPSGIVIDGISEKTAHHVLNV